jgi:dihydrodipicolinate synthase/N-acetylneuraminate lyase
MTKDKSMENPTLLSGSGNVRTIPKQVIVPTITPLTDRFKLDKSGVEKLFELLYANRVCPFILGTTGEAASLSTELKEKYIKRAGKLKQKDTRLYAGISSNSFEESTELAKYAFDHGVDAVVATLPSYYELTHPQMKKYFIDLADAIGGPLVIYNIPATTHMSIPLVLINELSYHPNIVATKDSERSEERLRESLTLWKERKDFSHFIGWAARSVAALFSGSDGVVPSTGNLVPGIYARLMEAVDKGDRQQAYTMQELSDAWGNLYQSGKTLGESLWALKFLMQQEGICQSHVMPPLQPLPFEQEERLTKGLRELKEAQSAGF